MPSPYRVELVRRALSEALAGPDRRAARLAFEQLLEEWASEARGKRADEVTQRVEVPR